MLKENLDNVLREVVSEAKAIGIPVSNRINPHVAVNSRPKKRFGCCRKEGLNYQIEISAFALNGDDKAIRGIIAHEVLHTCKGTYKHDSLWKSYAARMNKAYGYNIKTTSSYEEVGLAEPSRPDKTKYIIKCRKCGKEYPRQRYTRMMKRIRYYRCTCGGKLDVYEIR